MIFDAIEVYFIGRGRWWRSVDGADYRQFERFASDEAYYREPHYDSKMMLFLPVSETRRVKGVFSLTADDVSSYMKFCEKLPTKLHILMPSSSEDSVYQNDVRLNRIPRRHDLFFEIEHLEEINVVDHKPFQEERQQPVLAETPPITKEWYSLNKYTAINFIQGMAVVGGFQKNDKQSAEKIADRLIGDITKIQDVYRLEIDRQRIIDILLEPLDMGFIDYSPDDLRPIMLAFAACCFKYRGKKRSPLTGRAKSKKNGEINTRSISGELLMTGTDVSHDFIRDHLGIAHERFKVADESGTD